MPPDTELMQPELFGQDEHVCPGYDVCPIGMCGCRWLGIDTPWREAGDDRNADDTRRG